MRRLESELERSRGETKSAELALRQGERRNSDLEAELERLRGELESLYTDLQIERSSRDRVTEEARSRQRKVSPSWFTSLMPGR